jgi:hypothetical protein
MNIHPSERKNVIESVFIGLKMYSHLALKDAYPYLLTFNGEHWFVIPILEEDAFGAVNKFYSSN